MQANQQSSASSKHQPQLSSSSRAIFIIFCSPNSIQLHCLFFIFIVIIIIVFSSFLVGSFAITLQSAACFRCCAKPRHHLHHHHRLRLCIGLRHRRLWNMRSVYNNSYLYEPRRRCKCNQNPVLNRVARCSGKHKSAPSLLLPFPVFLQRTSVHAFWVHLRASLPAKWRMESGLSRLLCRLGSSLDCHWIYLIIAFLCLVSNVRR